MRARTGVTVVLAERPALAAADVRGGAPGTINTDALRAGGLISRVDGIVLSGGSVFGLEAATGLIGWLAARGPRLCRMGAVPADRHRRDPVRSDQWRRQGLGRSCRPIAAWPMRAADAAGREVALGNAGAGLGAMAGTLKGGLGTASAVDAATGITVAALVAVNPVGSVTMPGSRDDVGVASRAGAASSAASARRRTQPATPSRPSAASA